MAPTICSGKKRQTRTIATTNIRRHDQGAHHLTQTLSHIVNYVAEGLINPRVSASLRAQMRNQIERSSSKTTEKESSLNFNGLIQTSATSVTTTTTTTAPSSNHRHTQFSSISDNAVTSSTHSDTENSLDLRLANETLAKDSTAGCNSNITNHSTSLSLSSSTISELTSSSTSSSSTSHKETTSRSTSPCEGSNFQRHEDVVQIVQEHGSSHNDETANKETNQIHSSNIRKRFYTCNSNNFDSEEDEYEAYGIETDATDFNSEMSDNDNSTGLDMETDEADSMTSLDTEKSAQLKTGNHPLLRDKLLTKQQSNKNNMKPLTSLHNNTDGLLSIAIKTIKLVKRNQLLQQRLTQLQMETSEFIQSVLANPENRHFRENIQQKVEEVDNV